ncbi:DNA alkylation repair protein [Sphingomonas cavernae]|uniref:DNA alkylation repair protein n=1 Tax=Sphingomonas cavernae TaxID=2320861 RepID=A0A418WRZ3_9SPHN|nr:DNA alkylation repair protein [Sphingomonas cavernae]RJF94001.1 DNA alkylation repair protein [Sphingomonas cavernae]
MPARSVELPVDQAVRLAVATFEAEADPAYRDSLGPRYGIHANDAYGVKMASIQKLAKSLGRSQALADALWATRCYEARMLCAYVDDIEAVTPDRMDRWAADFDNWAVCDTLCFSLWDRTPHAFDRIHAWASRDEEFVKRASFALLASVALHGKGLLDDPFLDALTLIEPAAEDDRNFVKKGVNWALRAVGGRRRILNDEAIRIAERLAASNAPTPRWVGKDALKALTSPQLQERLAKKPS